MNHHHHDKNAVLSDHQEASAAEGTADSRAARKISLLSLISTLEEAEGEEAEYEEAKGGRYQTINRTRDVAYDLIDFFRAQKEKEVPDQLHALRDSCMLLEPSVLKSLGMEASMKSLAETIIDPEVIAGLPALLDFLEEKLGSENGVDGSDMDDDDVASNRMDNENGVDGQEMDDVVGNATTPEDDDVASNWSGDSGLGGSEDDRLIPDTELERLTASVREVCDQSRASDAYADCVRWDSKRTTTAKDIAVQTANAWRIQLSKEDWLRASG